MPNGRKLVVQHLEGVSGSVFDEYRDVLKELIRGKAGIYALYRQDKLYYVGLASNLMARLHTHTKDRHRNRWDRFSVYLTVRDDHVKELESLLLRIVGPPGNKTGGKFVGSKNLHSTLNRLIKDADYDRRARVLGGWTAKRRQRVRARSRTGQQALSGLFERPVVLLGWRGEKEYRARLRTDGGIRYATELYASPSAAATAALGRGTNGWVFWHYKSKQGEWTQLRALRS